MKNRGARILAVLALDLMLMSALVPALAGIAYKLSWEDTQIGVGVTVIYIVTNFAGGFLAGKTAGTRRFLWGMLGGALCFAAVSAIAWLITREFYSDAISLLIPAAVCMGSGMAGGMVSG